MAMSLTLLVELYFGWTCTASTPLSIGGIGSSSRLISHSPRRTSIICLNARCFCMQLAVVNTAPTSISVPAHRYSS
uniref:Putative secreted protein n=1 Tax=Anopheles marajoara TaxID=58244 RepID=A0A2M4CDU8_9DIPT